MLREVKTTRKITFQSRKKKNFPVKRNYLKPLIYVLEIIVVLSIPVIFFILPELLIKVENVSCKNQFGPCSNHVEAKLIPLKGDNLWLFSKNISKAISNDAIIEKYSYLYKFPNKMEVNVVERVPRFALKKTDSQTFALIDKNGTVLSFTESTNLPFLKVNQQIPDKGKVIDGTTLFALNIMGDMASYYTIQNANIEYDSLKLVIQGKNVIFPLNGDEKALVGGFNLIYSKSKSNTNDSKNINLDSVKTIDMRFKNPVLSF